MKETGAEATAGFGAEGEGHEWELGIGSLIIDLDADIEKTGSGDGLRMKIKRKNGGKVKHEVVMSSGSSSASSVQKKTVSTMTEPELFGPCDPGTSVTLDGVVWQETDGGVLVVNVTWREKSYVGTLLDCTRHDWAPPRLCDEANSIDPDNPKQRQAAKRSLKVRPKSAARRTANSGFAVPPSPGKQPAATAAPATTPARSPALIQCPEPNCNKKYKHINGLKYHQTHAHGSDRQPAAAVPAVVKPEEITQPVPDELPADQSDEPDQQQQSAEPMDETPAPDAKQPPPLPAAAAIVPASQPCPSSPAYSDISDANEECEEPGAESPDDLTADTAPSAVPVPAVPVSAGNSSSGATDTKPFAGFSFCSNFRSRDDGRPDVAVDPQPQSAALSFPFPYSYPPAFSLPASPSTGQNGEDGVCATMETTGPPPAPTSSYYLHPLSFPHFDPVYRMFPDKGPGPPPAQPAAAPSGPTVPVAQAVSQETVTDNGASGGSRSPPTQRHLHTHHHTHVGVPFPSYHPISFPIPLSNPAPRATK